MLKNSRLLLGFWLPMAMEYSTAPPMPMPVPVAWRKAVRG